jgi:hypothetical protein
MNIPMQRKSTAPSKIYEVLVPTRLEMPWWGCSERTGMLRIRTRSVETDNND